MRGLFAAFVWFFIFASVSHADFKVLLCEASCGNEGCKVHVVLDSQFIGELKSVLSEGADYVLELQFKGLDGRFSFKRVYSYDVIDRLYILKDSVEEEKIADPFWFYYKARVFDFSIPLPLKKGKRLYVRAVKRNPDLPFPFNLLPIGVFKTSWCVCRVNGGE
ncbi:MAG: hypothetical protein GXO44_01765 [Deferribacteres bacterium]|nr:hypothetical protein [Deferribacteres bacterium]